MREELRTKLEESRDRGVRVCEGKEYWFKQLMSYKLIGKTKPILHRDDTCMRASRVRVKLCCLPPLRQACLGMMLVEPTAFLLHALQHLGMLIKLVAFLACLAASRDDGGRNGRLSGEGERNEQDSIAAHGGRTPPLYILLRASPCLGAKQTKKWYQ